MVTDTAVNGTHKLQWTGLLLVAGVLC